MRACVLGFVARAGGGKTTAAQHVVSNHHGVRISFAKPLKELAKLLWDFSEDQVNGPIELKEKIDSRYGFSPRDALIRLGDGARKTLGNNVWINACFNKIIELHSKFEANERINRIIHEAQPIYVIDDVRYPNEVEAIRTDPRFNGYVVKLVYADSTSSTTFINAPSERSVDEVLPQWLNATIISYKTPESVHLKKSVDDVLHQLGLAPKSIEPLNH